MRFGGFHLNLDLGVTTRRRHARPDAPSDDIVKLSDDSSGSPEPSSQAVRLWITAGSGACDGWFWEDNVPQQWMTTFT